MTMRLPEHPFREELIATASSLALDNPQKGILSADENTGQMAKRFEPYGLENTVDKRRDYREVMFTTEGIGEHISGVILSDEAFNQSTRDGRPFVQVLREAGVHPGITVDMGHKEQPFFPGEIYTQGLVDLDERARGYYEKGARFAKWRAVLAINDGRVSEANIQENAWTLARYASVCQYNGLAPIIEPELMSFGDHSLEECGYWTEKIFSAVYKALHDNNVMVEGTLVKASMVLPGTEWTGERSFERNAECTLQTYRRVVPPAVPSIHFLTGTQTVEESTRNLNAVNSRNQARPWGLSFSFARGLQESCIKTWLGDEEKVPAAQSAFYARAKANGQARVGQYDGSAADEAAREELFEKGYKHVH